MDPFKNYVGWGGLTALPFYSPPVWIGCILQYIGAMFFKKTLLPEVVQEETRISEILFAAKKIVALFWTYHEDPEGFLVIDDMVHNAAVFYDLYARSAATHVYPELLHGLHAMRKQLDAFDPLQFVSLVFSKQGLESLEAQGILFTWQMHCVCTCVDLLENAGFCSEDPSNGSKKPRYTEPILCIQQLMKKLMHIKQYGIDASACELLKPMISQARETACMQDPNVQDGLNWIHLMVETDLPMMLAVLLYIPKQVLNALGIGTTISTWHSFWNGRTPNASKVEADTQSGSYSASICFRQIPNGQYLDTFSQQFSGQFINPLALSVFAKYYKGASVYDFFGTQKGCKKKGVDRVRAPHITQPLLFQRLEDRMSHIEKHFMESVIYGLHT
jgi:hypothetical protein